MSPFSALTFAVLALPVLADSFWERSSRVCGAGAVDRALVASEDKEDIEDSEAVRWRTIGLEAP